MLEILKLNRLQKLKRQYQIIKAEAKLFMKKGDLSNHIMKLTEAQKIKMEYMNTLDLKV